MSITGSELIQSKSCGLINALVNRTVFTTAKFNVALMMMGTRIVAGIHLMICQTQTGTWTRTIILPMVTVIQLFQVQFYVLHSLNQNSDTTEEKLTTSTLTVTYPTTTIEETTKLDPLTTSSELITTAAKLTTTRRTTKPMTTTAISVTTESTTIRISTESTTQSSSTTGKSEETTNTQYESTTSSTTPTSTATSSVSTDESFTNFTTATLTTRTDQDKETSNPHLWPPINNEIGRHVAIVLILLSLIN